MGLRTPEQYLESLRDGRTVYLWLAAALLAAGPALAQDRIEGTVYANARYGIRITRPAAWHFITAATVLDLARKTAGAQAPRDEDAVRAAGFAVIVSKTPTLGRTVEPQVIVLVHELPQAPASLVDTCERLPAGMGDPEFVAPTREVRLDGAPAARLDFRGLVDGVPVRATALCAVRERRAYVAVGQALAGDFDRELPAFETILASLRLN